MTRLLRWFTRERELYVDMRRLNLEFRSEERQAEDARDVAYKARVRYRMVAGLTAQQLAPLIQRRERTEVQ